MTATVRDAGPFEKLISFSVTAAELEAAKTKTARRLSQDLKIRGFRPGKAPRPIVESTVGSERLKSEAIDDLLPEKLESLLAENELSPAVTPELANLDETADGLDVEVKVTLWPTLTEPPRYDGRTVVVDVPEVTDDEVDEQIERIRDQFAQLEPVERSATQGDYVSIDLSATSNGVEVPEATASQLLYEIGSGGFLENIDDVLEGVSAGEIRSFEAPLPRGFGDRAGEVVSFNVTVTEVRAKVLPVVDDDWVSDITEFDTVGELRSDLVERILDVKRRVAADRFREAALDQLVDETQVELPDALVRSEMDEVLHRFVHRLESQGVTLDDYFQVAGVEQDDFVEDLRAQADRSLKTRLVLESVATAAGVNVTPEEVAGMIEALARQSEKPDEFRRAMARGSRRLSLAGDILRNKALEVILAGASAVDEAGNVIDLQVQDVADEEFPPGGVVAGEIVEGEIFEGEIVEGEVLEGEILEGDVVETGAGGASDTGVPDGAHTEIATERVEAGHPVADILIETSEEEE